MTPGDQLRLDWSTARARLESAIYLLAVEQPDGKFSYPFATATAVGPTTLLTSAAVASHLENDFRRKGFQVWASSAALKVQFRVVDFAVHKGWALTAEPAKRIYFDLGVLKVAGMLPKQAALASDDELREAVTGLAVACVGITHQCDAVKGDDAKAFDELAPRLTDGKILITTRLDPAPGSPRLLHVKAPIAANVYGSPIVNRQGKILGVYSEAAMVDAAKPMNLHYATVVASELVQLAYGPNAAKVWTAPPATEKPVEKATAEKPAGEDHAVDKPIAPKKTP